jgi:hypothetical protein
MTTAELTHQHGKRMFQATRIAPVDLLNAHSVSFSRQSNARLQKFISHTANPLDRQEFGILDNTRQLQRVKPLDAQE